MNCIWTIVNCYALGTTGRYSVFIFRIPTVFYIIPLELVRFRNTRFSVSSRSFSCPALPFSLSFSYSNVKVENGWGIFRPFPSVFILTLSNAQHGSTFRWPSESVVPCRDRKTRLPLAPSAERAPLLLALSKTWWLSGFWHCWRSGGRWIKKWCLPSLCCWLAYFISSLCAVGCVTLLKLYLHWWWTTTS